MMTVYQSIFDPCIALGSFGNTLSEKSSFVIASNFFAIIGGIGSSIVSNCIIGQVLYVLVYKRNLQAKNFLLKTFLLVLTPVIVAAITYSVGCFGYGGDLNAPANANIRDVAINIYYYIRTISIFFNIVLYGVIVVMVRGIFVDSLLNTKTHYDDVILEFIKRLKYYPLCQVRFIFIYNIFFQLTCMVFQTIFLFVD